MSDALIHEFEEMEANLFYIDDVTPKPVIGIFGDKDDVCDCLDEYREMYSYWISFNCGHRLTEVVIENTLLPVIKWLKQPDYTSGRTYLPFEDIKPGDTGFIGDMDNCENAFKIYRKGIGRKWYEEIVREYQGTKHHDGREITLHFPSLSKDANEKTVELVYGNRYCQTPSIEIYGETGVQVSDGDFIINDSIIVHRE